MVIASSSRSSARRAASFQRAKKSISASVGIRLAWYPQPALAQRRCAGVATLAPSLHARVVAWFERSRAHDASCPENQGLLRCAAVIHHLTVVIGQAMFAQRIAFNATGARTEPRFRN
jgi:hypothetical protein